MSDPLENDPAVKSALSALSMNERLLAAKEMCDRLVLDRSGTWLRESLEGLHHLPVSPLGKEYHPVTARRVLSFYSKLPMRNLATETMGMHYQRLELGPGAMIFVLSGRKTLQSRVFRLHNGKSGFEEAYANVRFNGEHLTLMRLRKAQPSGQRAGERIRGHSANRSHDHR